MKLITQLSFNVVVETGYMPPRLRTTFSLSRTTFAETNIRL
jgi:hypothetical protein